MSQEAAPDPSEVGAGQADRCIRRSGPSHAVFATSNDELLRTAGCRPMDGA